MWSYRSIQLNDLLSQIGKTKTKEILSDFSCPKNKEVEDFLKDKAIPFEMANLARTTLIYLEEGNGKPKLVAYYSVTVSKINIEHLPRNERKKLAGTSYAIGKEIGAILIGQLSKNFSDGNNAYISGKVLMNLVFDRIRQIDILIPSVVTYIDCEDIECLKKYYSSFGFELFRKNMIENQELLCYVISTKKIIDSKVSSDNKK